MWRPECGWTSPIRDLDHDRHPRPEVHDRPSRHAYRRWPAGLRDQLFDLSAISAPHDGAGQDAVLARDRYAPCSPSAPQGSIEQESQKWTSSIYDRDPALLGAAGESHGPRRVRSRACLSGCPLRITCESSPRGAEKATPTGNSGRSAPGRRRRVMLASGSGAIRITASGRRSPHTRIAYNACRWLLGLVK